MVTSRKSMAASAHFVGAVAGRAGVAEDSTKDSDVAVKVAGSKLIFVGANVAVTKNCPASGVFETYLMDMQEVRRITVKIARRIFFAIYFVLHMKESETERKMAG